MVKLHLKKKTGNALKNKEKKKPQISCINPSKL
jgi:hypothetical protein